MERDCSRSLAPELADQAAVEENIERFVTRSAWHQKSLSISCGEPLVRGRMTSSRSRAARARKTVSSRAAADFSMSETVRWRTPILVAKLSWLKPSSRLRSRMQLPSCKGVRAILSFVMGLGGYPPKAILGAFPPNVNLGAFPPNTRLGAIPLKEPGRLGASFSHRRRNPQRSKLASRPYSRIVTAPAAVGVHHVEKPLKKDESFVRAKTCPNHHAVVCLFAQTFL